MSKSDIEIQIIYQKNKKIMFKLERGSNLDVQVMYQDQAIGVRAERAINNANSWLKNEENISEK